MKPTLNKYGKNLAAFVANLVKYKDHQPKRITLSMIERDLNGLTTDLQSLYAKITIKACGVLTKAKSLFTNNR